jgi:hypothetical protein
MTRYFFILAYNSHCFISNTNCTVLLEEKILFSEGPFLILGDNNQFLGKQLIFQENVLFKIVVDILVTSKNT